MITLCLFFLGTFIIGFLLGERYSLRQCNAILDHNQRVLLGVMSGEPAIQLTNDEPNRPIVH